MAASGRIGDIGVAASVPCEKMLGEYRVERELLEGGSLLAIAPGGRRVVLKPLSRDCLRRKQLHPTVYDRLRCVRELAHVGVANLLGAERCGERVFLVWEYIEGQPLEDCVARGEGDRLALARDLVASIEALHGLGIVHGALHARNVIVRPNGRVCLTHISPLLYYEPEVDVQGLAEMLDSMGFGEAVRPTGEQWPTIAEMGARLITTDDLEPDPATLLPPVRKDSLRRRSILAAVLVALLGALLAMGFWSWASRQDNGESADIASSRVLKP